MTNLTTMQFAVLNTFGTYSGEQAIEATKSDLGVSWNDVADIARATGFTAKQVQGVLSGLVQRDLIQTSHEDGKPDAQCLTEAGVDALFAARAANAAPVFENGLEMDPDEGAAPLVETPVPVADLADPFAAADVVAARADQGNCAAIRLAAINNPGMDVKTFIAAGVAAGFNKTTISIQRSRALRGETSASTKVKLAAAPKPRKLTGTPSAADLAAQARRMLKGE